ncbi:MAG: glycosyltransferase [Nitrospira sp.]|nr:glycosyltransferase [Nitrospira sp.]
MLVPKKVFQEVGGFDERLAVEYNDVDLCLRIREQGYRIVYTPEAVLYHYENATRCGTRNPEDETLFCRKWDALLKEGDPYYHPHLTRKREDWSLGNV